MSGTQQESTAAPKGVGHGTIRLRGREAPAAPPPEARAPEDESSLQQEAKAAAQAAYEAYQTGHGRVPAHNAGELLARAAELAAKVEAAKGG